MNKIKKVIHLGVLPPPLGGISTYLYRLSRLNKEEKFIDVGKIGRFNLLKILIQPNSHFINHIFSFKRLFFIYMINLLKINSYSIVLHGEGSRLFYRNSNMWEKYIMNKILRKAQSIQVVNEHIRSYLLSILPGIDDKIHIKCAFLPPPIEDEENILKTYLNELFIFIKAHEPLIVANAFKLVFLNKIDLYGLDMCINLVAEMKKRYSNIGLIFALADDGNKDYLNEIKEKMKVLQIEDNIYFMTGQKELWPLFKKADLMVRPTCTDGDAVSIREALYFKCPVVASDVCIRPEGTVTFQSRNQEDFYVKVKGNIDGKNDI